MPALGSLRLHEARWTRTGIRILACALSGVLFYGGYYVCWPLMLGAAVPIAWVFCTASTRCSAAAWAVPGGLLVWMPLEHPLAAYSPGGLSVLCLWQAVTLIPVALVLRAAWRGGYPMALCLPVAWVGAEYLRILGPAGFPFGALAVPLHGQWRMIQVADLGGVHLLSLAVGAVNGLMLEGLRAIGARSRQSADPKAACVQARLRWSMAVVGVLWLAVMAYGEIRIRQVRAELRPGPTVTVIQPDVPSFGEGVQSYDPDLLLAELQNMTEVAVRQAPRTPDLILWPEAMTPLPLVNLESLRIAPEKIGFTVEAPDRSRDSRKAANQRREWDRQRSKIAREMVRFEAWVESLGVPVLLGLRARFPSEPSRPGPVAEYNTAQLYRPGLGATRERQFKMRLFPVGEFIPWLARHRAPAWAAMVPRLESWLSHRPRISAGTKRHSFTVEGNAKPAGYRESAASFCVSICGEILFPKSSGVFLKAEDGRKSIHWLASIANEGRFQRNRAQRITFAMVPFRAVEGRMSVARSANTGISCFADPTGRVTGCVTNEAGLRWTGRGCPEARLIRDLQAFRLKHETTFATNNARRAQLREKIEMVQAARAEAGIQGHSTMTLSLCDRITPYQKLGNWAGAGALGALALGTLAQWRPKRRRPAPGHSECNERHCFYLPDQ